MRPGNDYARKRFVDIDVENTGRGAYAINEGLQATKAFTAASVFDSAHLCQMSIDKVKANIKLLINFNFIAQDMIDGAMKDTSIYTYTVMNKVLPEINMMNHKITMKMNKVKKRKL